MEKEIVISANNLIKHYYISNGIISLFSRKHNKIRQQSTKLEN